MSSNAPLSLLKPTDTPGVHMPIELAEWAQRRKVDPAQLQTSVLANDPRVAVPDQ